MQFLALFGFSLALLTSANEQEWKTDDRLLIEALHEQGINAQSVIWNSPDVNWTDFDSAVVFSTWDYFENGLSDFFDVLIRIEEHGIPLYNPSNVIRWNSSKLYLKDLESLGLKTIESLYIFPSELDKLEALLIDKEWNECVIKPQVSGGGYNTFRFNLTNIDHIQERLKNFEKPLIVQPFANEIIAEGEWSFIFFDKEYVHCVLKKPAANNFLVQDLNGGSTISIFPPEWMIKEAKKIMDIIDLPTLHARLDVIRRNNELIIMEIELIEPNLFLKDHPGSEKKLALKLYHHLVKNSHFDLPRLCQIDPSRRPSRFGKGFLVRNAKLPFGFVSQSQNGNF